MAFLWPPRPETKVGPDALPAFETLKWVAQVKKNGTCTVLEYDPATKALQAWTRHNEAHKLWTPNLSTPCLRRLKELKGGKYILVGELLHSKVPGIKDTLYLFDILVADGKDLAGTTLTYRMGLLHSLWTATTQMFDYAMVDERLWVANLIKSDFKKLFQGLTKPEDEGLVLKKPDALLAPCWRQTANSNWQIKCRRPTKNYSF